MLTPWEEATRWANRAEENRTKADSYLDPHCRATMRAMARQADMWSERALTHAIALEGAHRRGRIEEDAMLSKLEQQAYERSMSFILRKKRDGGWSGPKSNEAIAAGDIGRVAKWYVVELLAEAFGKDRRDIARELIDHHRLRERGQWAP